MRIVYVVEDDQSIRELTLYALTSAGFSGQGYESGGGLFDALKKDMPDMILLDIMLPGEDGLSILKRLKMQERTCDIPIIMLTAKGTEYDKVKGLDLGADDYVAKPFGVMELISRINAVLRRTSGAQKPIVMAYEEIALDENARSIAIDGVGIVLTFKEFELLAFLMRNPKIVLSREHILERVWGYDFDGGSRTVDMHIKTLRQKLGVAGRHIETVRSVGYRLGV